MKTYHEASDRLRLQPLTEANETWTELSKATSHATLYHRESWIELLRRAYGLSFSLATLCRDGAVVAGCVLARSPIPFQKRFISLPFSDSCAPLAVDEETARELLGAIARQSDTSTVYEIRGISARSPWATLDNYRAWELDLHRPLSEISNGLALNFRRNLREAGRETIKVEHGEELDYVRRFYELHLRSRRRLGLPSQPWRFFKLTQEIFAREGALDVFVASRNSLDLASAVFLRCDSTVYYKWGARRPEGRSRANHLLFWNAIEEFCTHSRTLDLGRTDIRNEGLSRFKRELGGVETLLPYSFYPKPPNSVSSEALTGPRGVIAKIWTRLPLPLTRVLGGAIYRFLA